MASEPESIVERTKRIRGMKMADLPTRALTDIVLEMLGDKNQEENKSASTVAPPEVVETVRAVILEDTVKDHKEDAVVAVKEDIEEVKDPSLAVACTCCKTHSIKKTVRQMLIDIKTKNRQAKLSDAEKMKMIKLRKKQLKKDHKKVKVVTEVKDVAPSEDSEGGSADDE